MSGEIHEAGSELARLKRELERERKARLEAETIAEGHLRQLYDQQQELEKSEALFQLLFAANPLPVWVYDLQTLCFLQVNDAAVAQYGYSREEFLEMRITDIRPLDEATRLLKYLQQEQFASHHAGIWQHRRKDGQLLDVEITTHKLDYAGQSAAIVVAQNITERLRLQEALEAREKYFRHLIDNAMDLITILNGDGTIRFESPSMEKVLGYKPEDYLGKNAFDFVHPDDMAHVTLAFMQALQTPGDTPPLSFRFRHKDGSWRVLEGIGNNLLGDPIMGGIVFNSRDVTDQRRLEEQYLQSQKVQAIGRLAGGVAHDFNNILTAVIGYSDRALAQLPPGHPSHTSLQEIHRAADHAAKLTQQLLAFSRKQVLAPKVLELNHVITNMDKMLRRLLSEDLHLMTIPALNLWPVKVDPAQIEQVILNLALNARDAMLPGGKLTIQTANCPLDRGYCLLHPEVTPGDYVLLAISDSGSGMTPEVMAHLFEPFFTTKEQGKGTGLGLATCHGVVKQSGGHINAYSELGKGTTIKVYLPRVDEPLEYPALHIEAELLPRGTETVLVVEDEPMLLELAVVVLSDLGYRVLSADNGRQALKVIQSKPHEPIHLVLTDVVMPQMGGKELATQLQELLPHAKVLFCSGYTQDAIANVDELLPGTAFLQKPFTTDALARKVRELLDGK
jgi:PAS domain S-box-containing protein